MFMIDDIVQHKGTSKIGKIIGSFPGARNLKL